MAYRVRLTAVAETDAYAAFEYIRELSPRSAEKWLRGLFLTLSTLTDMPHRCPLAPEAEEIGHPIRHLLYGKRSGIYRIIFDIQETSDEGSRVRVLRIWHAARDRIQAKDIEEAEE